MELAAQGLADTTFSAKPTNGLLWTWSADNPAVGGDLQNMGAITEATARMLSCNTTITKIILNTDGVPLDVGLKERLFTPGQRKALLVRDRGCIKCGAHAGRCQAHHLHHWLMVVPPTSTTAAYSAPAATTTSTTTDGTSSWDSTGTPG